MRILSIETSCDDTAITIMEMHGSFSARGGSALGGKVLANASNSQIAIHAEYGGVYPMLAKREHIKNLPIILEQVLKIAKLEKSKKPVDVIAVTYGPGLEPALWTGIVFAKELAKKWSVPLIPVNHMEGHVLSVFGKPKGKFSIPKMKPPILSLLVSGGHTELVLARNWANYKIIGETLDDAAGEAFDKVARMLGLPYPGGPKISELAEKERAKKPYVGHMGDSHMSDIWETIKLPRPMLHSKNFDFSFSGLKTAVLYLIKKIGALDEKTKEKIALEFENAVVETLIHKTIKAKEKYKAKTVIVAGGVSSNKHLQREMKKALSHAKGQTDRSVKLLFPKKELTMDNSIMIGIAGYMRFIKRKGKISRASGIKAQGNLRLK